PQDDDLSRDVYRSRRGSEPELIETRAPVPPPYECGVDPEAVSRDGSRLFFSTCDQLSPADHDTLFDIYMRYEGRFVLISRGDGPNPGNWGTWIGRISDDGTRVAFETDQQLTASDDDMTVDVYEWHNG